MDQLVIVLRATIFSIILVLFSTTTSAFEDCRLTQQQASVANFAYSYGKPFDYGYTMVAIAMEESRLGKWNINIQDPSAGPWHVTLDKGLQYKGWDDTPFNRNRIAQLLMEDIYFAAHLAIEELLFWHRVREGNWRQVVSSYNGGWRGNEAYLKKISRNIDIIKRCGWVEGI